MTTRRSWFVIAIGALPLGAACGLSLIGGGGDGAPATTGPGNGEAGVAEAGVPGCSSAGGCAPVVVFTLPDGGDVRSLAVDERYVYFTSEARRTVARIDHAGKNEEILADNVAAATISAGPDALYWVVPSGPSAGLHRANLDGGADRVVVRDALGCVFVGPDRLTLGDLRSRRILELGLDGGGQRVIGNVANGIDQPYGVAVSARTGSIFFTHSGDRLDAGGILRFQPGVEIATMLVSNQQNPNCMAIEDERGTIYWANYVEGAIRRSQLDGGRVEVVASGLVEPVSIVVTPEAYWWNSGGSIVRQPR